MLLEFYTLTVGLKSESNCQCFFRRLKKCISVIWTETQAVGWRSEGGVSLLEVARISDIWTEIQARVRQPLAGGDPKRDFPFRGGVR